MTSFPPTWVIVAHRAGARFFEYAGRGKPLALIETLDHPEGRKLNSEIDSDRAGRIGEAAGKQNTADREQSAHEHVSQVFAHSIAEQLRQARNAHRFSRLVLVAEPKFLGMLLASLDGPTADMVVGRVAKDLAQTPDRDVAAHLQEVLAV